MPTLRDLWGNRPLSDLAIQVGIPFRRLEAYADGTRTLSPADRAALAAFFRVEPASLTGGSSIASVFQPAKTAKRDKHPVELPPAPVVRAPRPEGVPPPTSVVTAQGTALARVSGVLQHAPEPAPDSRNDPQGEPRFWLLELLVPHQPLRGPALYLPMRVRCAVHRRQFAPFRWLEQGDKVVLTGTIVPRSDHLYLFAATLSTPRADRLLQLLADLRDGKADAEAALIKLLGDKWQQASASPPGSGVQTTRPPWSPLPAPADGAQGRVQITLNGQLQADPTVELDEATGGTAELRLEIAPLEEDGRLPVVRYRVQMRLRTLRDFRWLQRGDSCLISGDIVRFGPEILVEATTIQLPPAPTGKV